MELQFRVKSVTVQYLASWSTVGKPGKILDLPLPEVSVFRVNRNILRMVCKSYYLNIAQRLPDATRLFAWPNQKSY